MKVVGLTGPSGAGKDEAAKIMERAGAEIINVDQLAHQLYAPQTPLWREIVKAFGSKVLDRGGKVNRKKLGEIVFSDKEKLAELDRIVHPHLRLAISRKLKDLGKTDLVVINAALPQLFPDSIDEVWFVKCPLKTRLQRWLKRKKDKKKVLAVFAGQPKERDYLKIADRVIRNTSTLLALKKQIRGLLAVFFEQINA